MRHFNSLLTKSLFSATLLAMSAAANAQVFEKVADDAFLHTHRGSPAIADINNDGLMDIYYGGEHYSGNDNTWGVDSWEPMGMIFINKGNSNFEGFASTPRSGMNDDGTFKGFGLPPTIWNTTRWIDFNNDGNLDFLSTGRSGDGLSINEGVNGGCYTLLYKNGGAADNYKFALVANTGLAQGVNEANDWAGNGNKSSISIGDYDHDGYADIVMQIYHKYMDGDEEKGERKLALYKNNGDGTFTEQKVFEPIPYESNPTPGGLFDMDLDQDDNIVATPKKIMRPLTHGAVAMGDLNGDGWLDIVATGWADGNNGGANMTIYKNNGDGTFSEVDLRDKDFVGLQEAELVMADVNNDGNLDFIAFGSPNVDDGKHADIYLNNGDGEFNFTRSTAAEGNGLYGGAEAQVRACDLNHDGLVDFISTGWSDTNGVNNWGVRVLFQNASGTFDLQDKGALPDLFYNGGFELGHLTSATSVDVFGTGEFEGTAAKLFKNTDENEVETPEAPTNVEASYENGKLTITWAGNEDNLGTAYNVYVKNKETGWTSMILPADIETGALKTIQDLQTALRSDDPSSMSYTLNIPEANYEVGVSAVNPDAVCSAFTKTDYVSTGIKTVSDNSNKEIQVIAVDGGILAQGTSKATVSVYNAAGQLVAKGVTNKVISATAGLYLVKVDNQTRKVLVK